MIAPLLIQESTTARAMRLIARLVAAGRLDTVACGKEWLPERGPGLIVARHYHHMYDGLALFAAIPRQFHIVVALDWVDSTAARLVMTRLNRLARWPVFLRTEGLRHRNETARRSIFSFTDATRYRRRAFGESVQLLSENRLLVIFPEGYPNIDPTYTIKTEKEQFLRFKPGFVAIARAAERRLGTPVPIIPMGLRYTSGKPWTARVRFGEPLYLACFASRGELIRHCEKIVMQLSL